MSEARATGLAVAIRDLGPYLRTLALKWLPPAVAIVAALAWKKGCR